MNQAGKTSWKLRGWIALLAAMGCWAFYSISIEGFSQLLTLPQQQAFRQYSAVLVIGVIVALRHGIARAKGASLVTGLRWPQTRLELGVVIAACTLVPLTEACFIGSIYLIPVGLTSTLVGVFPGLFSVALLGLLPFTRKHLRLRKPFWLGLTGCVAGFLLINLPRLELDHSLNWGGTGLALLASFLWACYAMLNQRLALWGWSSLEIMVWISSASGLCYTGLMVIVKAGIPHLTLMQWLILFGSGIAAGVLSHWLFNEAIRSLGSVIASIGTVFESTLVIMASALFLHQYLNPVQLLGVGLLLIGSLGVYLNPAHPSAG
jgi:drug/metabolite transporter (DMT)-like permease